MRANRRAIGAAILCFVAFGASLADDFWLETDPPFPRAGEATRVRLFRGDRFEGRELPYSASRTASLQRVWRYGRANLKGREDARPLASFTADRPGVQLIVFNGRSTPGGPVDRFCKTIALAGKLAPGDPLRWSELGQRLEIVPQTDPVELARSGGQLEVQVLYEREPLAGAVVSAVPQGGPPGSLRQRKTDEIGLVRFSLDRGGRWLIKVNHVARCEDCRAGEPVESVASLVLAAGAGRS